MNKIFNLNNAIMLAALGYFSTRLLSVFKILFDFLANKYVMSVRVDNESEPYKIEAITKFLYEKNKKFVNEKRNSISNNINITNNSYSLNNGYYFIKVDKFTYVTIYSWMTTQTARNIHIIHFFLWGLKRQEIFQEIKQLMIDKIEKGKITIYNAENLTIGNSVSEKNFDSIFGEDKNTIKSFIDSWLNSKELYQQLNKQYKLGIMLYGKPGTGKTSIGKWLASYIGNQKLLYLNNYLDYYDNNFRTLTEVISEFKDKIVKNGISLIIIEEIDKYINNEKIINSLLQLIDGIDSLDNVVIVATTNNYEKLPENLIRSGRFDLTVEMKELNYESTNKMLKKYNVEIDLDKDKLYNPAEIENKIFLKIKGEVK